MFSHVNLAAYLLSLRCSCQIIQTGSLYIPTHIVSQTHGDFDQFSYWETHDRSCLNNSQSVSITSLCKFIKVTRTRASQL